MGVSAGEHFVFRYSNQTAVAVKFAVPRGLGSKRRIAVSAPRAGTYEVTVPRSTPEGATLIVRLVRGTDEGEQNFVPPTPVHVQPPPPAYSQVSECGSSALCFKW